jgi:putative FmdB family regulatory protein
MPIYEYQCLKCGEIFEVFQKLSDPPPKSHKCGSRRVQRVMSKTSFVLKGTGWYITDYGRKSGGGTDDGSSSSSGKSSGKASDSGKATGSDSGKPSGSDSGKSSGPGKSSSSDSGGTKNKAAATGT